MDLGAYANIEDLKHILEENSIVISRLRGLRLMKYEELISQDRLEEMINSMKLENAIRWLKQKSWNCWSSQKDNNTHPAFIYDNVEDIEAPESKIVAIDWSKVDKYDKKTIDTKNKEDEQRIRNNIEMYNSYIGKDVLYVHARQGGFNRKAFPIDTTHTMYLSDCDDWFDETYCDIYYDLTKSN